MIYRHIKVDCQEAVDEVTFHDPSYGNPLTLRPDDKITVTFPDGKIVAIEFMRPERGLEYMTKNGIKRP